MSAEGDSANATSMVERTAVHASALPVVSRETAERLTCYVELLQRWNPRLNLVSPRSLGSVMDRHIDDSLQLAPLIPATTTRAADVGSGAGFPGLVLAIVTKMPFLLIEADQRKAAFLREAARVTSAPVQVLARRVETVRAEVDVVTARAFADVPTLLRQAMGLLRTDTVLLLLKGASPKTELAEARQFWAMDVEVRSSTTRAASRVLILQRVRALRPALPSRGTGQ